MNIKLTALNLSEAEKTALNEFSAGIKKIWPQAKLTLFGSKATGTADDESDVDLLVELPEEVTEELRRHIIHKAFEVNLAYDSNINPLIVSQKEWEDGVFTVLPIHRVIEIEGIPL
jgi:DNA polymerase sigma